MKKYIFLPLFLFSISTFANTVTIFAEGEAGPVKTGWGFFITKNLVVTTFKAAEKAPKLHVALSEDPHAKKVPVQSVMRYSGLHDIVVLQVPPQANAKTMILAKDVPAVGTKFGNVQVVKIENSMFPKMFVSGTSHREGAYIADNKGVVHGVLTDFDPKTHHVVVTPGKSVREVYASVMAAMKTEAFYAAATTQKPDIRTVEMLKVCENGIASQKPEYCWDMAQTADAYKMKDTKLELLATGCLRGHSGPLCESALKNHLISFKWDQVEVLAKEYCNLGSKPACLQFMKELLNKKKEKELVEFATPLCNKMDGDACTMLGKLQESKDDFDNAEKYYLKGCEYKSGYGCGGASGIYYSQKKLELERKFLTEGCNLKDGYSCFGLGTLAEEAKSHGEKIEFYKKGCDLQYGPSCHQLYVLKLNAGEKNKTQLVEEYAFVGCAAQNAASCEETAQYFFDKGQFQDSLAVSKPWCSQSHPKLCVIASKAADAVKDEHFKNYAFDIAVKAFESDCEKNNQEACKWKQQLQQRAPASK